MRRFFPKTKPPEWHKGEWIAHDGGPCPVHPATTVEFRINGGKKLSVPSRADSIVWRHEGTGARWRVTSYRILTPLNPQQAVPIS